MKRKPRKYQSKLTLHPMTFEHVVDTVLKYRPTKNKKKQKRTRSILVSRP
jgi:hypothetical protein